MSSYIFYLNNKRGLTLSVPLQSALTAARPLLSLYKHENIYLQFSLEKLLDPTKTPTHVKASIFLTKKSEQ